MKILIHSDEYYPTGAACAYRMKVFANVLSEKGHEVTVITSSTNYRKGSTAECHERIIYAPTYPMKKKTGFTRLLNNLSFAVTSVFASFGVGKTDIVLTTSPPALLGISGWLISRLKRAALVYDVRDIWPDVALEMNHFTQDSMYCKVFRWITDFMYRYADMISTVSPGKVIKIRSKIPQSAQDKVCLVANGFDEGILANVEDPDVVKEYSLDEKFTCIYIGNIGLAQGLNSLLEVASQTKHKDIQFLIFGTGAEEETLKLRAEELKLCNLHFCGVVEHSKVFTLLKHAKLSFISLKNANLKDSIPTKIYEALGLGCPVVLVAEGDACSVVNETEFGVCVSPEQLQTLVTVFDETVDRYEEIFVHRELAMSLMKNKYSRQQIASDFEEQLQVFLHDRRKKNV